jgi:hypothetical protein
LDQQIDADHRLVRLTPGCRDLSVTVERDRGTAARIYRLDARTLRVASAAATPPVDAIAAGGGAAWAAIGQRHALLRIG